MPLWVINGPDGPEIRLPLFPRKRTQVGHRSMSGSCHNRKWRGTEATSKNAKMANYRLARPLHSHTYIATRCVHPPARHLAQPSGRRASMPLQAPSTARRRNLFMSERRCCNCQLSIRYRGAPQKLRSTEAHRQQQLRPPAGRAKSRPCLLASARRSRRRRRSLSSGRGLRVILEQIVG
jgi:hypothetical protein